MTAVRGGALATAKVCNATLTYMKHSPKAAVGVGNFGSNMIITRCPPLSDNSGKVCGHLNKMHVVSLHGSGNMGIIGARDADEAPADLGCGDGVGGH